MISIATNVQIDWYGETKKREREREEKKKTNKKKLLK